MDDTEPDAAPVEEPSAAARVLARHTRDVFVALTSEGFSEVQALQIVGIALAALLSRG